MPSASSIVEKGPEQTPKAANNNNNNNNADWYEPLLDGGWMPDAVLRQGIRYLLSTRASSLKFDGTKATLIANKMDFIRQLKEAPIAIHADAANEQHYEVPSAFIQLCLGKRMKYSCCLFPPGVTDLDQAEELMLESYCLKARLRDGQSVLDLGCGWGSLSLFLAEKYPNSQITGLSNSASQKQFIVNLARDRHLTNLTIITRDVQLFETDEQFDRVTSIEMLEHMKNYSNLFNKISSWLKQDGLFFCHIFSHIDMPYNFDEQGGSNNWMARYFFTGGTMPSDDLFLHFQEKMSIVDHWFLSGEHYAKTSEAWLKLMDSNYSQSLKVLTESYGSKEQASVWINRWRLFYLSVAELFNYRQGEEWGVTHYLFQKK